ncbi:cytidine deaminase [Nitrospirillum sp. BR 11164]|uniref:cytidine deaminase n=1 Tax=Nitrospirillum sp. BR 11164 TaxID=3104324 RepID=UPI002AFF537E|nr:cytidine deaminase [Nitrospirillum sp. BR 11164]MEA1649310.1 cytidine deaminase [Nitrospirillum sp. BR 11164]
MTATPPAPAPTPAVPELFAAAASARGHAHAPYSRFLVGAALRTPDGAVFAGGNVENAAYPQGQCAEASAIGAMVAGGKKRIAEIVVIGAPADPAADASGLCTPCGGCRQRLREFSTPDTLIHVAGPEGVRATFTMDQLLPFSFGPDNLSF